jgi:hypothetical protein
MLSALMPLKARSLTCIKKPLGRCSTAAWPSWTAAVFRFHRYLPIAEGRNGCVRVERKHSRRQSEDVSYLHFSDLRVLPDDA